MMVALETVLKTYSSHGAFLKGIRWLSQSSQNFIASDGCEALWEGDGSRISSWSSMSKSGKRCGDDDDAELHFGMIG